MSGCFDKSAVFVNENDDYRFLVARRSYRKRKHMFKYDVLLFVCQSEMHAGIAERSFRMSHSVEMISRFLCVRMPVIKKEIMEKT